MKIETPLDIGQVVYYIYEGKIKEASITHIEIEIGPNKNIDISYRSSGGSRRTKEEMFSSKKEAAAYWLKSQGIEGLIPVKGD